jgi:hypothetical protein
LRNLPQHGAFPSFVSGLCIFFVPLHSYWSLRTFELHGVYQPLVDVDTQVCQKGDDISSSGVPAKLAERISDDILLAGAVRFALGHEQRSLVFARFGQPGQHAALLIVRRQHVT